MKTTVDLSALPHIKNPGRMVILKSKWYPKVVNNLSVACQAVLSQYGYDRVEEYTLPGCLEIPLAASQQKQ